MSDVARVLGALGAGGVLGTMFFGGLWWTVSRGLTAAMPAVWFGLSALLRLAVTCCGIYLVARSGLLSLMACLGGIVLARFAVTRLTRFARIAA
jgi:F1F0 ATPase subunit 2